MRLLRSLLLAALAAIALPALASAATRYASPSGGGPAATCPPADPSDLQTAVENVAVNPGDAVIVLPGTYNETSSLQVTDAITVAGAFLPLIDFNAPASDGIVVDNPGAAVRDLSVDQVAGTNAVSIRRGTVERVRAKSTGTSACALRGSSLAAAVLRDSTCWSTGASGSGVAAAISGPGQSGGTIRNVTAFAQGAGGTGVSSAADGGGTSLIDARNSIAIGTGADVRATVDATSTAAVTSTSSNYSTAVPSGGAGATITAVGTNGNQGAEPLLVAPTSGQFDQLAGSPTVDAGTLDASIGTLDVNFDPRVQNEVPDIGADELPDAIPPQTTIGSGPSGPIAQNKPTFAFTASESAATFACQLDDDPFETCTSPFTADPLTQGPHSFRVRAADGAGNVDRSPAERSFTVDRNVSGANVSAKRSQRQGGRTVTLKLLVRASEDVEVSGRGSVRAGGKGFAVTSKRLTLPSSKRRALALTPKKKSSSRKILAALERGERATANLSATFVDDLGNKATSGTVAVKLKAK